MQVAHGKRTKWYENWKKNILKNVFATFMNDNIATNKLRKLCWIWWQTKYLPSMMPFNIQTNGQKYDGATSDSTQRESKPPIENPRKSSNGYFICTVGNVKSTIFASLIVFSFDNIAWWIPKRLRFLINNVTICQDETV